MWKGGTTVRDSHLGVCPDGCRWWLGFFEFRRAPWMIFDLVDGQSAVDVAVQHAFDQVDAVLAHDPRNPELVVQNLIDAVERVLLVHERVEQDSQGPDVLFLAPVRSPLQNLGGSIIWGR